MKLKIYLTLVSSFLLLLSCTKDFKEINNNPNAPTSIEPQFLLRQVVYDLGEQMSYESFVAGNLLRQHFAMIDFDLFDRHNLSEPQLGGNPWPVLYRNLRDNETLLQEANSTSSYAVYRGPALILKAYIGLLLTDMYGDVPFFEAVRAKDGITNPRYSLQEDIYNQSNGILSLLEQAVEQIDNYQGSFALEGDILFNGDLNQWKKFANSLQIKALMRISAKQDVSAKLQALVDAGNYLMGENEHAAFDFNASQPNNFRMANLRPGDFNSFTMSQTSEEILKMYNDPRISTFFRTINPDSDDYNGTLNGRDASESISLDTLSLPGTIFRENTAGVKANFMSSWETRFFIAEAIERGIISGSAKEHYDKAVESSFSFWNVEMPNQYTDTGAAAYNNGNPLEQIITQKWIGNFLNGYEAWAEYRRTGFPALKTVGASLNNNLIPVRMPYPTDEQALNPQSYNEAAARTDGNSVNAPVWWDN